MTKKEVTVLDLYHALDKIVNKYPYYTVKSLDNLFGSFQTQKLKPNMKIDRKNRRVYLETTIL